MKNNLIIRAILSSFGVLIYTSLISWFITNAPKFFGPKQGLLGSIAFLLIFVVSAAITGALVLGKPILLYLDNQKSDAIKLFFYTIGWLAVITILVLGIMAMTI